MDTPSQNSPGTIAWQAGMSGLTCIAHYSVPDLIGPKPLRFLAKTAINVASFSEQARIQGVNFAGLKESFADARDQLEGTELTKEQKVATIGTATVVGTMVIGTVIIVEKWLYHSAERRKLAGVAYPHVKQSLAMGVFGAAMSAALSLAETKSTAA